jgi:hypothetical protein
LHCLLNRCSLAFVHACRLDFLVLYHSYLIHIQLHTGSIDDVQGRLAHRGGITERWSYGREHEYKPPARYLALLGPATEALTLRLGDGRAADGSGTIPLAMSALIRRLALTSSVSVLTRWTSTRVCFLRFWSVCTSEIYDSRVLLRLDCTRDWELELTLRGEKLTDSVSNPSFFDLARLVDTGEYAGSIVSAITPV